MLQRFSSLIFLIFATVSLSLLSVVVYFFGPKPVQYDTTTMLSWKQQYPPLFNYTTTINKAITDPFTNQTTITTLPITITIIPPNNTLTLMSDQFFFNATTNETEIIQIPTTITIVWFDTHAHSINTDGWMTLDQVLLYHKLYGYPSTVISDHNVPISGDDLLFVSQAAHNYGLIFINAFEWSTRRLHLVIIGDNVGQTWTSDALQSIFDPQKQLTWNWATLQLLEPTDAQIKRVIDRAHSFGQIVIAAHLFLQFPNQPSYEHLIEWGVDYMELVNNITVDTTVQSLMQQKLVDGVCGTDVHMPFRVDCWTGLVMNGSGPFSSTDLMGALGQHQVVVNYLQGATTSPPNNSETNIAFRFLQLPYNLGEQLVYNSSLDNFFVFIVVFGVLFLVVFINGFILHPQETCQGRWERGDRSIKQCGCCQKCCINRCFFCYKRMI